MALNFNQFATEGNTFMKEYAKELRLTEDPDKAARILTTILHGMREMISTEESLQFIAQLPMFLKAVYVNGWTLKARKDKIKTVEDFIDLLRSISGITALADFESDKVAEEDIYSTFNMLKQYVSSGQIEDMKSQLPKQLKRLLYDHSFN
ncbi:MAG: DUF2267 domain-containing protein [Aequorivita sp.]